MKEMTLRIYPEACLMEKTIPFKRRGREAEEVVSKMFGIMRKYNGVGLAGPQVGLCEKIFVMEVPNEKEELHTSVCINPTWKPVGKAKDVMEEGCLSLPSARAEVSRYVKISVRYVTIRGKIIKKILRDLPARVFQHEWDHLRGVLFIDYLSKEEKERCLKEVKDFKEEKENE